MAFHCISTERNFVQCAMTNKTYGQLCPLARSLDVLGDRWTLLLIRELLLGPKRFKDLLAILPAMGTNRLSERLAMLVQNGVIQQVTLHTFRHARLRADGLGRATTQAGDRAGILGAEPADRRTHRSVQCSCGAHSPVPDRLERFGSERRFAGVVRVPGGSGSLPYSSQRREPVGTIRAERRAHRRQNTMRHGNLHCVSPAPDHANSRTSRRSCKAVARGSTRLHTSVQSTRIQALGLQVLSLSPSLASCESRGTAAITSYLRPARILVTARGSVWPQLATPKYINTAIA